MADRPTWIRGLRWREVASALVWAVAAAIATFFVGLPSAAIISAWGGLLGYLGGCILAATPLRTPAVLLLFALVYGVLMLFGGILGDSYSLASILGAARAFTLGQWLIWGGRFFCFAGLLRFLSGRQSWLITAEVLSVTLLLASPLAAHRQGFINRPYFLADPLWSRNIDPLSVLVALGALAAVFLVVLQNGRRTTRSSWLDVLLLIFLIGGIYALKPERKLLNLDLRDTMGIRGKEKEKADKEREARQGGKGKESQGQSGRSEAEDNMPLDQPQEQKEKQEPVAIVLLRDDYTPPYETYYFRQTAFSQYNGKRLVADTTGKTDRDLLQSFPVQQTQIPSTVPANSRYHRKLATFTAMIKGHTRPFTMVDGVSAAPAANPNTSQFVRAYDAESQVLNCKFDDLMPLKAGDPSWDEATLRHYTEAPADPRYKKLAEKCVQELPEHYRNTDFARALVVKLYMDRTMTYTTKARHDGVPDPVAHYLFEDQRGYCVHQAHAAVYLWRSLGLPSRVGAGYATSSRNRGNGSAILLRSGEAHAWPEVYLQNAGWVVLDITPEKHIGGEMDEPDPNLQRMLGELARNNEKRPDQDQFAKKSIWEYLFGFLRPFAPLLWLLVIGPVVGIYGWKFWRRFEPLWCKPERMPVSALRSGLDQLAEVGAYRRYGEGRVEFARRLGLEALEPLTYRHFQVALGRGTSDHKELLQLREQLHQQIARRYPLWRRVLGFLNPFSWMFSR